MNYGSFNLNGKELQLKYCTKMVIWKKCTHKLCIFLRANDFQSVRHYKWFESCEEMRCLHELPCTIHNAIVIIPHVCIVFSVERTFPICIWVFPKCFPWKNILVIKSFRTCHLLCMRLRCYHSASKTQVSERIFKLSPIHASVIYQIPWIHWISDPSKENSIVSNTCY